MSTQNISAFFVYGTLKKSYLRGGLWPRKPLRIFPGTIQSDLFDLGSYPAASPGTQWLLGEIWEFVPEDMEPTIAELDQIEGYYPGGISNEYNRLVVTVESNGPDNTTMQTQAFAYFAAQRKQLEVARKIRPFLQFMGRTVAAWPDSISRVPSSFSEE